MYYWNRETMTEQPTRWMADVAMRSTNRGALDATVVGGILDANVKRHDWPASDTDNGS